MNKKKIFKLAKGFQGRSRNCYRLAKQRVERALQYAYRDRRNKKRDMRSLWIQRINAGSRLYGVPYGNFIHGLMKENIQLNRKVLSELSMHEPSSFKALVEISHIAFPGNRVNMPPPKYPGNGLAPPKTTEEKDEGESHGEVDEEEPKGLKLLLSNARTRRASARARASGKGFRIVLTNARARRARERARAKARARANARAGAKASELINDA